MPMRLRVTTPPMTNASGEIGRRAPQAVRTPRPPLKPIKIGKQCPSSAARPAIGGPQPAPCWKNGTNVARSAGPIPLERSRKRTISPGTMPSVRCTLLAPILRLPCWRMSKSLPRCKEGSYASNQAVFSYGLSTFYTWFT